MFGPTSMEQNNNDDEGEIKVGVDKRNQPINKEKKKQTNKQSRRKRKIPEEGEK